MKTEKVTIELEVNLETKKATITKADGLISGMMLEIPDLMYIHYDKDEKAFLCVHDFNHMVKEGVGTFLSGNLGMPMIKPHKIPDELANELQKPGTGHPDNPGKLGRKGFVPDRQFNVDGSGSIHTSAQLHSDTFGKFPHTCPVCNGKGTVLYGFYGKITPNTPPEECKSCKGTGVVWG